jgi:DNA-binding transcriptional regulator YiaG
MEIETAQDLVTLSRLRGLVKSGTARAVRAAAGLSIAEMARAAQVSTRSIQRWERGQTTPHGDAAVRYGRLLDQLMRRAS